MKARTLAVIASDDDLSVEVSIIITPAKGHPLEESEMDTVVKQAGRLIAQALFELPYADFGIENTRIQPEGIGTEQSP